MGGLLILAGLVAILVFAVLSDRANKTRLAQENELNHRSVRQAKEEYLREVSEAEAKVTAAVHNLRSTPPDQLPAAWQPLHLEAAIKAALGHSREAIYSELDVSWEGPEMKRTVHDPGSEHWMFETEVYRDIYTLFRANIGTWGLAKHESLGSSSPKFEKQRQDKLRALGEEQRARQRAIFLKRASKGLCVMCGEPLRLWQFKQKHSPNCHKGCFRYRETRA